MLELELINDDKNTHCAVLPSNGDTQFLWMVNHSKGKATLELDGPGYYWYGSTSGNDEGRGLTGAIVVSGEVPPDARLTAVRTAPVDRRCTLDEKEHSMATEYVDAGEAIRYMTLSADIGYAPPVAKDVNYERILNARDAEPHNWLTYYGAYDGQRYSTLDQITAENVGKLKPQWVYEVGSMGLHSGPPRTRGRPRRSSSTGPMYVSAWDGQLYALDAEKGHELWRYKHASPFDVSLCCGNVNRGVAVAEGKVFMATLNAHLVAIDAETGKKICDQPFGDVRAGESATVAPADRQGHGHRRQLRR